MVRKHERARTAVLCAGDLRTGRGRTPVLEAGHRSAQAGDCFRGSCEGRVAGGREAPPTGFDELDLVRVEAVHGRCGQLAAGRAGRVGLIHRFDARVQRRVFGMHLGQAAVASVAGRWPMRISTAIAPVTPCRWTMVGRAR